LAGAANLEGAKPMQYASPLWRENQSSGGIYIFRSKLQWLGEVEAASAEEAIIKGAEAFGQNAKRLMAVRR
jgi:monoamine oxidase